MFPEMPFWAYFDTLCLAGPSLVSSHFDVVMRLSSNIIILFKIYVNTFHHWRTEHRRKLEWHFAFFCFRFLVPWSLIINSDLQKRNYIGHLQFTRQRLEQKRSDISFKELGISFLNSVNHVDWSHSVLVRFLLNETWCNKTYHTTAFLRFDKTSSRALLHS